ncbi:amidohydrolase family protein [Streptomyces pseudovenezuelae]|uniref:TIM-barrel fold metal-dependent hydrolase n=1 Tax=Streptomyces pseudovenezuelae TaxID=67350 RepID=A0ABT6LVT4_9ACTN|nr:amidohydrolase family protein [Streptomyces pseudovenezuelae]MDH6220431.1 putative TIM-barrel fold metal-dependent hydrolase [Streptomyces pseudovenezuelae]
MIIDAHSHVHDPLHVHLSALDDAGVDRSVLFPTRPHPERATDLASLRREMSVLDHALGGGGTAGTRGDDGRAAAWRELDEALAAHPDRFLGFGSVRLDRPAAEIAAAVDRDVVARGLHGIGELTPPPDRADLVEPVLQAAHDHGGLPVVVHGFAPTTAADVRTLVGLAVRYPRVPLVIGQLAGTNWMEAIELARTSPNVYLELSTAGLIFAVRLAIRELPSRTLFGSDAPYGDPVVARTTVERVTQPGEVRERVLGGNLAELLHLS